MFDELRIDLYFRSLAVDEPAVRLRIGALAGRLLAPGKALVHGDFSPKNLLVSPDGRLLLVDHEVAHYGDPAFDIGFCLSHLFLKGFRAPHQVGLLLAAAMSLTDGYRATTGAADPSLDERVAELVAALMLARIDGKSPVEYLDDPTRRAVRSFAIAQLAAGPADIASVLAAVEAAAG